MPAMPYPSAVSGHAPLGTIHLSGTSIAAPGDERNGLAETPTKRTGHTRAL
jgi:hypothetical protein